MFPIAPAIFSAPIVRTTASSSSALGGIRPYSALPASNFWPRVGDVMVIKKSKNRPRSGLVLSAYSYWAYALGSKAVGNNILAGLSVFNAVGEDIRTLISQ